MLNIRYSRGHQTSDIRYQTSWICEHDERTIRYDIIAMYSQDGEFLQRSKKGDGMRKEGLSHGDIRIRAIGKTDEPSKFVPQFDLEIIHA